MTKAIKKTVFVCFFITCIFTLNSCGGVEQTVLSIPGMVPTPTLFVETLGTSERDAEQLMEEIEAMKNDFLYLTDDSAESDRGILNSVESLYIGELSFG